MTVTRPGGIGLTSGIPTTPATPVSLTRADPGAAARPAGNPLRRAVTGP